MNKNKLQQKNNNTGMRSYQLFLPLNYEVIIPEKDSVRLLSLIMEDLDYTELYEAYSQEGRNPAVEPKIFAKVMVYAYMEFTYSTRKIERACRRDVNFMWLLNGETAPDHIEYYIKPQTYEQQKKRSFKKNISKRENMNYNAETDEYTCHNQKQLKPVYTFNKKSATGYISQVTVYECECCEDCPCKDKCNKASGNRRMQVSKTFIEKRKKPYENITTETGVLLRMNRSIQSEGAFGVLKEDRQFDRF